MSQLKREVNAVLFGTKLNWLLVALPVALLAYWAHWNDGLVFVLSTLALCPLAERLGFVTEQLAG